MGGNRKRYQQSTNADRKSVETVFLIAICRHWGDKWQSKMLFLFTLYLSSLIVLAFFIAAYPVCSHGRIINPLTPSNFSRFFVVC